ncbi:D-alanyl-D-alanine carboxypeptidase [Streptomyces sp. NPDC054784]
MAGESPDRSDREKSSGKTTEHTPPVPSTRSTKRQTGAPDTAPATGAAPEEEPGGEPDAKPGDRSRAAAGTESRTESRTEPEAEAAATPEAGTEPASEAGAAPERDADDAEAEAGAEPSGGSGAGSGATAVLGIRDVPADAGAEDDGDGDAERPPGKDATTDLGVRDTADADRNADGDSVGDRTDGADDADGERDGTGGGDARLRDAVAAWVSSDEPEADAGKGEGKGEGDASAEKADKPESPRTEAGSAAEEPVRPPAADPRRIGGTDRPTAMFGVLRPEDTAAGPAGEESARERAERMTAAFFGTSRDDADDPAGKAPGDADASDTADARIDQPTTAFRLPPGSGTTSAPARGESDAERTSQFVPLKPDLPDRSSAGAKATDAPAKPAGDPRAATGAALPPSAPPAAPPAPSAPPKGADTGAKAAGIAATTGTAPADPSETTQQPAVDPPPLDLLAQLTNKPPPPETPMRTAVRRVKIWTPLAALLAIVFVIAQSVRPLPDVSLSLTAPASYAFEGAKPAMPWPDEGQAFVEVSGLGVLGSKGGRKSVSIGSVAKTMTAYVVLKKHPLKKNSPGPSIKVDKKAEEDGKLGEGNGGESVLDTVKEGDELSERDALSALMIPSANNIARLLARWHSDGSETAFVKEMNKAAEELGMSDTTYTDPSGLKESTRSTAEDQVKLAKKVMEIPALVEITKLPEWTDPSGKKWRNYNTLVPFDGAIGIKTGSTTVAGGNLLFAGHKKIGDTTQLIVGAVLGQHKPPIIDTANAVSKDLLVAAGDALAARKVVEKGDVVGHVDDQLGGKTPVVATEDVTAIGWPGLKVELGLEEDEDGAPHTADAGEKVGVLTAGDGPGQVKVPVALQEDLAEPGFGAKLTRFL